MTKNYYDMALDALTDLYAQVHNGGFYQWYANGYADQDMPMLKEITAIGREKEIPTMKELEEILFSYRELAKVLAEAPYMEEYIICPECRGSGQETWDDTSDVENCFECDGDGEVYNDDYFDVEERFEETLDSLDDKLYELYDLNDDLKVPSEFSEVATAYMNYKETNEKVQEFKAQDGFKPYCKLIGKDGNIFNLMGIAGDVLTKAGRKDLAAEMTTKIRTTAESYQQALTIICEYVDVH